MEVAAFFMRAVPRAQKRDGVDLRETMWDRIGDTEFKHLLQKSCRWVAGRVNEVKRKLLLKINFLEIANSPVIRI